MRQLIGIIGGLGPLASARFLATIYRSFRDVREQQTPRVVLYSDPTFPDRTDSFLKGEEEEILARATRAADDLIAMGADRLIFCCYTIHRIVPRLPARIQAKLVSLLDVAVDSSLACSGKILVLCTSGTRRLQLFEGARNWEQLSRRARFPNDWDQQVIHDTIYALKRNNSPGEAMTRLVQLLGRYPVDHWLLGCTELHLLSSVRAGDRPAEMTVNLLDPLNRVAELITADRL